MFSKYTRLIARVLHPKHVRCLLSNAGDTPTLTIQETRAKIKVLVDEQMLGSEGNGGTKVVAPSQDELPRRTMTDSIREAIIPLGSNTAVKEIYRNYHNGIRFGRILEDLDTFAVAIGYTHSRSNALSDQISPISIVTAQVDRISMSHAWISPDDDIKMTGKVTWVGESSMEITMDLDQEQNHNVTRILTAKFVMVALHPETTGKAPINRLLVKSPEEQQLFDEGEASKDKRLIEGQITLMKTKPNQDELSLIHELFRKTIDQKANSFKLGAKPANCTWVEDTILKSVLICMPEQYFQKSCAAYASNVNCYLERVDIQQGVICSVMKTDTFYTEMNQKNFYNKIFGGFLMRKAFELAWANAVMFCQSRPFIIVVDGIAFRKPVEVGSLLFLSSQIAYCVGTKFHVTVHAEAVNPTTGTRKTTNDFHFIFNARDAENTDVNTIIPKTYAEAMLYLDGKRHVDSC